MHIYAKKDNSYFRENEMVENVAKRPLETTRHLQRRSPRDRIIFISEKKENKIEIHKTKIKTQSNSVYYHIDL